MMIHRKTASSPARAQRERSLLRLIQGDGVVPMHDDACEGSLIVETARGNGSLADVLAERRRLVEEECRAVGARVATIAASLHARQVAHGDIKPANVIISPTGDLWLADFDAAAPLGADRDRGTPSRLRSGAPVDSAADVIAIAIMVVECATGAVVDPQVAWSSADLRLLGCPAELASDVATIFAGESDALRVAGILQRRNDRLPDAAATLRGVDPTPTLDFETTAIDGLSPAGHVEAESAANGPERLGWRRWARQEPERTRTDRAN